LSLPRREIDVYRDVLATAELDTPRYLGSLIDDDKESPRYWLFVEHVRDAKPLWQCDLDQWPAAARWLKRLHGQQFAKLPPTLLRYDESFYWKWMERAAENKPPVAAIARRYQSVIDQLVQLPATFIHGEFYPSNILVQG